MQIYSVVIPSPVGNIRISANDLGITEVTFTDEPINSLGDHPLITDAAEQLDEYFRNKRTEFTLTLTPDGTDFQKRVWDELLNVPFGVTMSYLELTRKLGDEKAIRAVAAANGKNPIAIIIPCHRIIGSDGSLTGYAGGLHRKQWLLRHEGAIEQLGLL